MIAKRKDLTKPEKKKEVAETKQEKPLPPPPPPPAPVVAKAPPSAPKYENAVLSVSLDRAGTQKTQVNLNQIDTIMRYGAGMAQITLKNKGRILAYNLEMTPLG